MHFANVERSPRLSVRGLVLHDGRLLIVNAYRHGLSDLWCAPGGGVEAGESLPDGLRREIREECGLDIRVGQPCLVNEFHDPSRGFHQVEIFFRCALTGGLMPDEWVDPAGIVTSRRFASPEELAGLRHKPDSLARIAWGSGFDYDPLELIVQ